MFIVFLNVILTHCLGLILNVTVEWTPSISVYKHMTADFGVKLSDSKYERSAPLVVIEPEYGCDDIDNGKLLEGSIAIVKRGQCSLIKKAQNVVSNGGIGVVIANNRGSQLVQLWTKSFGMNQEVDIPCVFISELDYNAVIEILSQAPERSVIGGISSDEEYEIENFVWPKSLNTEIIFVFLFLLLICSVRWLWRAYSRNRERRLRKRQVQLLPEVLFSLDLHRLKSLDQKHLTNTCCPICLIDFEKQTRIKLLPCDHGFHLGCIEPWIEQRSDNCPVCRQKVMDKIEPTQWWTICWYNFNSLRPVTVGSSQSFSGDTELSIITDEIDNFISSADSEQDNLTRVGQVLEVNDINYSPRPQEVNDTEVRAEV